MKFKRILSILLAALMMVSLGTAAFAAKTPLVKADVDKLLTNVGGLVSQITKLDEAQLYVSIDASAVLEMLDVDLSEYIENLPVESISAQLGLKDKVLGAKLTLNVKDTIVGLLENYIPSWLAKVLGFPIWAPIKLLVGEEFQLILNGNDDTAKLAFKNRYVDGSELIAMFGYSVADLFDLVEGYVAQLMDKLGEGDMNLSEMGINLADLGNLDIEAIIDGLLGENLELDDAILDYIDAAIEEIKKSINENDEIPAENKEAAIAEATQELEALKASAPDLDKLKQTVIDTVYAAVLSGVKDDVAKTQTLSIGMPDLGKLVFEATETGLVIDLPAGDPMVTITFNEAGTTIVGIEAMGFNLKGLVISKEAPDASLFKAPEKENIIVKYLLKIALWIADLVQGSDA